MVAAISSGADLPAETPAATPRPSSEELKSRSNDALQHYRPAPARAPIPVKINATGIAARSTVLTDGRRWTIVPRGALLDVSASYADRVNVEPRGELVTWNEFYRFNSGWLHRQSVQSSHARGESAFSEEQIEAFRRTGRVTVAVLQGLPVTVDRRALEEDGR